MQHSSGTVKIDLFMLVLVGSKEQCHMEALRVVKGLILTYSCNL